MGYEDMYSHLFLDESTLEKVVIGGLMNEKLELQRFVSYLNEGYFMDQFNRGVFLAIKALTDKSQEVDVVSVVTEMRCQGYTVENQDMVTLMNYSSSDLLSFNLEKHVALLIDRCCRMSLIRYAGDLMRRAVDPSNDLPNLLVDIMQDIKQLEARMPWKRMVETQQTVGEQAMEMRDKRIRKLQENGIIGIHTGIEALDEVTSGWLPQELNVIAGKTGSGKTWFMIKHMMSAARDGMNCLVISLEMTNSALYYRELSVQLGFSPQVIKRGGTADEELRIREGAEEMNGLPIRYMDVDTYDIDVICSLVRKEHIRGKCDIVFVDYMQIIPPDKRSEREIREVQVRNITQKLKNLAKQEGITVIALAQLNRNPDKAAKGKPKLGDMRESSTIEQFADNIFLLWTPEEYGVPEYEGYHTRDLVVYIMAKGREEGYHEFFLRKHHGYAHLEPAQKLSEQLGNEGMDSGEAGNATDSQATKPLTDEAYSQMLDELYS